jgi:hypothetical protein
MAPAPLLRRAEGALEPGLFRSLRRAVQGLERERLRSTYQTTFWFDLDEPRCLPEAAALALRPRVPPGRRVVGVEWWLSRMRTSDVRVDFHQDRDEKLALRTGQLVHPRWSSVFFLNRCRGGLLAVTDQPPCEDNPSLAPRVLDLDLARPFPNRFVLFDGRLTHGVLDDRNRIPGASPAAPRRARTRPAHGATPVPLPWRLAVVFNWWHRRPLDVPRWGDTRIYRSLALPAVRAPRPGLSPAAR